MTADLKPIIISADDFAQSAAIDTAIITLIEQKRLSAASCLTLSPRWTEAAKLITPEIRKLADIGLHLDFTQFAQIARKPLGMLIIRSLLRSLSTTAIEASVHQQLDQYEQALGAAPDYIDGHQHVHQLPQIREALLEIILKRYGTKLPWIRIAAPPLQFGLKGQVIRLLGSGTLKKKAEIFGLKHTTQLLGVYGFDGDIADYRANFEHWLNYAKHASPSQRIAMMCHPATESTNKPSEIDDPILNARMREYGFFANKDFAELLAEHQLSLGRGSNFL
jgi:predicted glycoside hydrolase/deacetylase ChbG (UPF0249 family)